MIGVGESQLDQVLTKLRTTASATLEYQETPLWERGFARWAYLDLNQGPLPYQGSALTKLSYRPEGVELYQADSRSQSNVRSG